MVVFGIVNSTLLFAFEFCFHRLLDCSSCWFLGVAALILPSPCNKPDTSILTMLRLVADSLTMRATCQLVAHFALKT